MAKIKPRDHRSMVTQKISIEGSYQAFLASRIPICAAATIGIYKEKQKEIVRELTARAGDWLNDLTAAHIRDYLAVYGETHNAGGTHRFYSIIRAFLNWAWMEYDIDRANPISKVKVKQAQTAPISGITRQEIEKIMQAIREISKFPERDTALVSLLADTGLRKSSLCSIRMKDIDVPKNELIVFEKDQRWHRKAFGTATQKALQKYLSCLDGIQPDDPLWLNQDGSIMTADSARQMLQRMEDHAGIPRHQFHAFRRFYGLELYRQTKDIYFVSRMLDHKNVEVTKRYLAIDQLEDAAAMRLVSPMDNGKMTGIKINRLRTN